MKKNVALEQRRSDLHDLATARLRLDALPWPGRDDADAYAAYRRLHRMYEESIEVLTYRLYAQPRNVFHGYKRLTHKYRNGWAFEDEWQGVGQFRMLRWSEPIYHDDDYDGWTRYVVVKAPRGASHDDVVAVLNSEFDDGCRCEHDCCGHVQSSGSFEKHLKRREYLARVSFYRNV